MNIMGVQAVLAVLLLFIAAMKADEALEEIPRITIHGEKFKMICPHSGKWFYRGQMEEHEGSEFERKYDNSKKGPYYCEYDENTDDTSPSKTKYYFYVRGKVCKNCFELEPLLLGVAIVGDVIVTVIVMLIIYKCTEKKSSAGPTHASKAPARSGEPAQSSHYEQLNARTRTLDTYSIVNRTG